MHITERHIQRVLDSPMGSTLQDVRDKLIADGLTDGDVYLCVKAADMLRPGIMQALLETADTIPAPR